MKFLITLILSLSCFSASAETITIAVASNFTGAMNEIIDSFEAESRHQVQVSYGSSGRFYAQIINGAPFDAFFSADQEKPALLVATDLASNNFTYATGVLVLWSKLPDIELDQATFLSQGLFNKLSMANPRLAPYGQATVEVLNTLGLEESTREYWVQGESITQAYQFVESGNAELGFVALSQIIQSGALNEGSSWRVPAALHSPIKQDAVLLNQAEGNQAAIDFLNYIKTEAAQAIIKSYGYQIEQR